MTKFLFSNEIWGLWDILFLLYHDLSQNSEHLSQNSLSYVAYRLPETLFLNLVVILLLKKNASELFFSARSMWFKNKGVLKYLVRTLFIIHWIFVMMMEETLTYSLSLIKGRPRDKPCQSVRLLLSRKVLGPAQSVGESFRTDLWNGSLKRTDSQT